MKCKLKWWFCGWYSIKDFKYWYWIQDDYGSSVQVTRNTLCQFHNQYWISPFG